MTGAEPERAALPGPTAATGPVLYPAIDLRDGRCVRLYQGDYGQETVYGDDPLAQASAFVAEGATVLHVVDLDAARTGEPTNRPVIAELAAHSGVPLQVGGGVRDRASADALFEIGVGRIVIGTAALERPELVAEVVEAGGSVAVGIDARGDEVATHGWTERTGVTTSEVARRFDDLGVEALVVTEIGRDGTMEGPDTDGLAAVLAATGVRVVASGGVGSVSDLESLSRLAPPAGPAASATDPERRLDGVIVGRALYEQAFTVTDALAALAGGGGAR